MVKTPRTIWSRIRSLWQRPAVKREIDEELRFHLEQRTAKNLAAHRLSHVAPATAPPATQRSACQRPGGSLRQSNSRSFFRTDFIRSSGKTPIAPLTTDTCSVVSLSTRIEEGLLRPVFRHSEWLGLTATVRVEGSRPTAEVMNATRKSSGESHCASTRHGRRLVLVKSVKGNAAWTISPDRNMPRLFSEARICPPREDVVVAVNLWLFFEESEGAAGFSQTDDLGTAGFLRLKHEHSQARARRQRNTRRQLQHAILFHDFDGLHEHTLDRQPPIAKPQSSTARNLR